MGRSGQRWCIWIDIEGFSNRWDKQESELEALDSLRELMTAIYRIGTFAFPENPERIFAHQAGDGFAIVSEFGEPSLERPVAIATALLRHVATTKLFAKAAI